MRALAGLSPTSRQRSIIPSSHQGIPPSPPSFSRTLSKHAIRSTLHRPSTFQPGRATPNKIAMQLVGQIQAQNHRRQSSWTTPTTRPLLRQSIPRLADCSPLLFTVGKPSDLHHRLNTAPCAVPHRPISSIDHLLSPRRPVNDQDSSQTPSPMPPTPPFLSVTLHSSFTGLGSEIGLSCWKS